VRAARDRFFRRYWQTPAWFRGEVYDYEGFACEASEYAYELLAPLGGARVLELGTGQGYDAIALAERGARVVAADLAEAPLRSLREKNVSGASIRPVCMLAEELACRSACFDRIFGRTVLLHVLRPSVWHEVERVLKSGQRAVFIEPLRVSPLVVLYRIARGKGRSARPRYLSLGEIIRLNTRFRTVEHREFYLISVLALGLRPVLSRIGLYWRAVGILKRLDEVVFDLLPWARHLAWISVFAVER
jgi:SAM-dependent methyltransferase